MGVSLYLLIFSFSYLVVVKIAIGEKPKKEVNGQQYRFTLVGGEKKGRLCFCTLNWEMFENPRATHCEKSIYVYIYTENVVCRWTTGVIYVTSHKNIQIKFYNKDYVHLLLNSVPYPPQVLFPLPYLPLTQIIQNNGKNVYFSVISWLKGKEKLTLYSVRQNQILHIISEWM